MQFGISKVPEKNCPSIGEKCPMGIGVFYDRIVERVEIHSNLYVADTLGLEPPKNSSKIENICVRCTDMLLEALKSSTRAQRGSHSSKFMMPF